jgi:hypothetical protein
MDAMPVLPAGMSLICIRRKKKGCGLRQQHRLLVIAFSPGGQVMAITEHAEQSRHEAQQQIGRTYSGARK